MRQSDTPGGFSGSFGGSSFNTKSYYNHLLNRRKKKKKYYASNSHWRHPGKGHKGHRPKHRWELQGKTNFKRSSKKKKKSRKKSKKQQKKPKIGVVHGGKAKSVGWDISSGGDQWMSFETAKKKSTSRLNQKFSPSSNKKGYRVYRTQKVSRNKDGDLVKEELIVEHGGYDKMPNISDLLKEDNWDVSSDPLMKSELHYFGHKRKYRVFKGQKVHRKFKRYIPQKSKKRRKKGKKPSKRALRPHQGLSKKKKECLRHAKIILRAHKSKCYYKPYNHIRINKCLERGNGIAKTWSKRCGAKVKYRFKKAKKVKVTKKLKKVAKSKKNGEDAAREMLRCSRQALHFLRSIARQCWKKNKKLGHFGKKLCKISVKSSVKKWTKKCGMKVRFEPSFAGGKPRTSYTSENCHEVAYVALRRYVKKCWKLNKGLPKSVKKCLNKGKSIAAKWSRRCKGKLIKYSPKMPKIEKNKKKLKTSKCRKKANKIINHYVQSCWSRFRGRSWRIYSCLKQGSSLGKKWTKECKTRIRYHPSLPKIPLQDKQRCRKKAYTTLRYYVVGCWRKYRGNRMAVRGCLAKGKAIAGTWSRLCRLEIKYSPKMPKKRDIKCVKRAHQKIRLYMRDCRSKHTLDYKEYKACMKDGYDLANRWSGRCKTKIEFKPPKIPRSAFRPKRKPGHSKCYRHAYVWLKVYEKHCWRRNRGDYKKTVRCLRLGFKHAKRLSKKCSEAVPYHPKLPEKRPFCLNSAKFFIRKYVFLCRSRHRGRPRKVNKCLDGGKKLVLKWEVKCGVPIKYSPKHLKVKNKKKKIGKKGKKEVKRSRKESKKKRNRKKGKNRAKIGGKKQKKNLNEKSLKKTIHEILNSHLEDLLKPKSQANFRISKTTEKLKVNSKIEKLQKETKGRPSATKKAKETEKSLENLDIDLLKGQSAFLKRQRETSKRHSIEQARYNRDLIEFGKWHEESKKWVTRLKKASNTEQYNKILFGYKSLIHQFDKKFKDCLPPPPPAPPHKILSPVETTCHAGYREGYKQGKLWARLISNENGRFSKGTKKMQCFLSWLKEKTGSLHHQCAIRGAKKAYRRWWRLLHHRKLLKRYKEDKEKLRAEETATLEYYKKLAEKLDREAQAITAGEIMAKVKKTTAKKGKK